jgi:hypothetical protein
VRWGTWGMLLSNKPLPRNHKVALEELQCGSVVYSFMFERFWSRLEGIWAGLYLLWFVNNVCI